MATDFSRGYSARWRVHEVNPETWADGDALQGVDSVEVERTRESLMESGTIEVARPVGEGFAERYLRVVMVADQSGAERVEVSTLLCSSASGTIERGVETVELEGRSVLYPASTRILLAGTYAPKGADGAAYAAGLLRECCACPVEVEGSFALGQHVVFDVGSTYLEAAWSVLDAGGFCMQVDGHGAVHVRSRPSEPALVLDKANARMLDPRVSPKTDLSEVPNRYYADEDGYTALAVNDDPDSPVSVASRGYYVDEYDSSPKPLEGETMAGYARRRLEEMSVARESRTYTREYAPGVLPWSMVKCSLPDAGLAGDLRVNRQTLECGKGITVTEESYAEVPLWQA